MRLLANTFRPVEGLLARKMLVSTGLVGVGSRVFDVKRSQDWRVSASITTCG